MDIHVKIITGHSYFNPSHAIVGVSLQSESDTRGLTKLADDIGKTGRPCTVLSDREDTVHALRSKWEDWAAENGHTLVWGEQEAVSDGF